jgi:hypothetical protein
MIDLESTSPQAKESRSVQTATLSFDATDSLSDGADEVEGTWIRLLWVDINPCQPWFASVDQFGGDIDFSASFAPHSWWAVVWKLFAVSFAIATFCLTWVDSKHPGFYMAYLTHWGLLLAVLYVICSVWNTLAATRSGPRPLTAQNVAVKTTWAMFAMAAHAEALISVLWWTSSSGFASLSRTITFVDLAPHLIIAFVVWFDGLVVNRIPIRWMHWIIFVVPLEGIYALWTLVHHYTKIGNPDTDQTDAIYKAISWEDDWVKCLATLVINVFVFGPLIYAFLWLCSAYTIPCICYQNSRRYLKAAEDGNYEDQV